MDDLPIKQAKSINGTIEVPGDKSISHRALIFGSLCEGEVEVSNFLEAEDCLSTLKCLQGLGVNIERNGPRVLIHGVSKYGFKAPAAPLDVGNSGTTLRILPGLLAAQNFESTLIGDESVSKRPMDRIIDPLSQMGTCIKSTDGHAPIAIKGGHLKGISYKLPVASAQVKSAVLLAGLFAEGQTTVTEDYQSRDHTERMLSYLEADIRISNLKSQISNVKNLIAKRIEIPGDISSATFFVAAALLIEGSKLTINNLGLNPTRVGMLDIIEKAGAIISKDNERSINNEPVADLVIESSKLRPFEIESKDVPLLIDEIPILSVLATQINGKSTISGAAELRVKETDRLKAISDQLSLMGADIEEKPDGLIINGPTKLKGTVVNSLGDHRMAMSLTIAGLLAQGQTVIKNSESIDISFPGFSKLLEKVVIQ